MRMMLLLILSLSGCRWIDRASAERHEARAKEEAKSLNLGAALDEHEKAVAAKKAAKNDPLP